MDRYKPDPPGIQLKKWITKVIQPPVFEGDPQKTKVIRLSYPLMWVLLGTSLFFFIITPIDPTALWRRFVIIASLFSVSSVSLVLSRKGHVTQANQILLAGLWLIGTVSVIWSGGVRSSGQGIYIVIVVLAGFIRGKNTIAVWTVITLITSLLLFFFEATGVIPSLNQSSTVHLTTFFVYLIVIALIFYLSLRQIERASRQLEVELFQKKAAQKEYARSETRFRQMLEISPLPMMIGNRNGKIEFMNRRMTEQFGYTIEDTPDNTTWFKTVYPDPQFRDWVTTAWNEEIEKIAQYGGIIEEEYTVVDKWSQPRQVLFFANMIQNKVVLVLNDVTKQRRLEAEVRENEILYRSLFDNVQDGIYLMDDDRLVECNQQILTLFHGQKNQLIGKTLLNFSPERQPNGVDSKTAWQVYRDKTRNQSPQTFEWQLICLNGSPFMAQITLSTTHLPQGAFFLAQIRDISKQKQDQAIIQRSNTRMETLYNLETVISTSFDLNTVLNVFLNLIVDHSEADAAIFFLYDPVLQVLKFSSCSGFHSNIHPEAIRIDLGSSLAGKAAFLRQPIHVHNFSQMELSDSLKTLIADEGFISYNVIPMVVKGELKGVLEIFQRHTPVDPTEWFAYMETLANRAAIAIDNAHLFTNLQRANLQMKNTYDITLEGWVYLLSQRDDETEEHTRRVVILTERLAKKIGVPDHELVHLLRGALLHDIGKIVVPDRILFKPGPLDDAEWEIMRQHPAAAFQSLSRIDYLKPAIEIPYCHHERWDGSGYPRGLKGTQIPLAARIFAIVDVWDALSQHRPYREAWGKETVLAYMRTQSGRHFDPAILPIFFDLIENEAGFSFNNEGRP